MKLSKVIKLLAKVYPDEDKWYTKLEIYTDGSGEIHRELYNYYEPNETKTLFGFDSINELESHLAHLNSSRSR